MGRGGPGAGGGFCRVAHGARNGKCGAPAQWNAGGGGTSRVRMRPPTTKTPTLCPRRARCILPVHARTVARERERVVPSRAIRQQPYPFSCTISCQSGVTKAVSPRPPRLPLPLLSHAPVSRIDRYRYWAAPSWAALVPPCSPTPESGSPVEHRPFCPPAPPRRTQTCFWLRVDTCGVWIRVDTCVCVCVCCCCASPQQLTLLVKGAAD